MVDTFDLVEEVDVARRRPGGDAGSSGHPGLAESGWKLLSSSSVDGGSLGGKAKCGLTESEDEQPVTVCGWADNGSIGIVLWMSDKVVDYSLTDFHAIRAEVEQKS